MEDDVDGAVGGAGHEAEEAGGELGGEEEEEDDVCPGVWHVGAPWVWVGYGNFSAGVMVLLRRREGVGFVCIFLRADTTMAAAVNGIHQNTVHARLE